MNVASNEYLFIMDNETAKMLCSIQDQNRHWTQPFKLKHHDVTIDLAEAVGDKARIPHNNIDQACNYSKGTFYRFDSKKFNGKESFPDIDKLVQDICVVCSLYLQRNGFQNAHKTSYQWRCQCYKHIPLSHMDQFEPGKFGKIGTQKESVKEIRKSVFLRMNHSKLKYRPHKPNLARRKRTNKHNGYHTRNKTLQAHATRRTFTHSAISKDQRCMMCVNIFMDKISGDWFLQSNSVLQHRFHPPVKPDTISLTQNDLSDSQLNYINLMYEHGVPSATIANIMNQLSKKDGNHGVFLAATIRNINAKTQEAMDALSDIDADFSIAKKTILTLKK